MYILFCDSVVNRQEVEPDFEPEWDAARLAGFQTALIGFEALTEGRLTAALKYIQPPDQQENALYRGWMLTPAQYEALYQELQTRNLRLINPPAAYRHCHYLPESYPVIREHTPRSVWLSLAKPLDFEQVYSLLQPFGDHPLVVKDFVKSEKHHWESACFIPAASDREAVKRVVTAFLALRGEALNEGLVFRAFEPLRHLTTHSRSGMPLTREFRLFWLNHKLLGAYPYWEEGMYDGIGPDPAAFYALAQRVQSHFFSMDVAQAPDGTWRVMELGDGQVTGLPVQADVQAFYAAIRAIIPEG